VQRVKADAALRGQSLKQWIAAAAEERLGGSPALRSVEPKMVQTGTEPAAKDQARQCSMHDRPMRDFGSKWVCDGPPQHSEAKLR
jgi:hypothetical protein